MKMDERKKKVLLAIIHDYVSTAEPVGSRTISRKYKLGVSPATIRNEMADLEDLGYIEQPHTSAGRVPSDLGYRYYVDYLMQREQLTCRQQEMINRRYQDKCNEIAKVINRTGQLLTDLTNYPSMVLAPQMGSSTFKLIQLVSMSPTQAMVIAVMDTGSVHHQLIEVAENITQDDLHQISAVLNAKLSGVNLNRVKQTIMKEIHFELSRYKAFIDEALSLLETRLNHQSEDKIYLGGVYNILNQPEFQDIEKLKTLLSMLEQDNLIHEILMGNDNKKAINVRIGVENRHDQIKDCTMVTAIYTLGGKPVGSIGVLGPTRMEYAKVISIVEHLAMVLNQMMEKHSRS